MADNVPEQTQQMQIENDKKFQISTLRMPQVGLPVSRESLEPRVYTEQERIAVLNAVGGKYLGLASGQYAENIKSVDVDLTADIANVFNSLSTDASALLNEYYQTNVAQNVRSIFSNIYREDANLKISATYNVDYNQVTGAYTPVQDDPAILIRRIRAGPQLPVSQLPEPFNYSNITSGYVKIRLPNLSAARTQKGEVRNFSYSYHSDRIMEVIRDLVEGIPINDRNMRSGGNLYRSLFRGMIYSGVWNVNNLTLPVLNFFRIPASAVAALVTASGISANQLREITLYQILFPESEEEVDRSDRVIRLLLGPTLISGQQLFRPVPQRDASDLSIGENQATEQTGLETRTLTDAPIRDVTLQRIIQSIASYREALLEYNATLPKVSNNRLSALVQLSRIRTLLNTTVAIVNQAQERLPFTAQEKQAMVEEINALGTVQERRNYLRRFKFIVDQNLSPQERVTHSTYRRDVDDEGNITYTPDAQGACYPQLTGVGVDATVDAIVRSQTLRNKKSVNKSGVASCKPGSFTKFLSPEHPQYELYNSAVGGQAYVEAKDAYDSSLTGVVNENRGGLLTQRQLRAAGVRGSNRQRQIKNRIYFGNITRQDEEEQSSQSQEQQTRPQGNVNPPRNLGNVPT